MNWMLLNGGGAVSFDSGGMHFHGMSADDVLRDFSMSLSNQVRAAGRFSKWPVTKHSLLVAHLLPAELGLEGLAHDAHEAITADIPTPWVNWLPDQVGDTIKAAKQAVQVAFEQIVGYLPWPHVPDIGSVADLVHRADQLAFHLEVQFLMPHSVERAARDLNLRIKPVSAGDETIKYMLYLRDLTAPESADLWYGEMVRCLAERRAYIEALA